MARPALSDDHEIGAPVTTLPDASTTVAVIVAIESTGMFKPEGDSWMVAGGPEAAEVTMRGSVALMDPVWAVIVVVPPPLADTLAVDAVIGDTVPIDVSADVQTIVDRVERSMLTP